MSRARPEPAAAALLRSLYSGLLWLILPLLPLRLWWRGRREPGYRRHVGERFGRYPPEPGTAAGDGGGAPAEPAADAGPLIWIHAVSLGETRAAQPLARALSERQPQSRLLVTHMTATGRAAGEQAFPGARVAFLPYDYPFAVRAFLRRFRPAIGILMETELWPNLLAACRNTGVPVLLANARLSTRSAARYRLAGGFAREIFGDLSAVAAQSEGDAARLAALGAPRIAVTGNLKFDMAPPDGAAAAAAGLRAAFGGRPVWLLASTRENEEAMILEAVARDAAGPRALPADLLLVVVPRHPQRFEEVARFLARALPPHPGAIAGREGSDAEVPRRSRGDPVPGEARCFLGDTLGELFAFYLACDLAFVGGSLAPLGGQNLIEACAAGAPVLVGPSTFNFEEAARGAIAAGAARRVTDADALVAEAAGLLRNPPDRAAMADAGRGFAAAHRGAAARVAAMVEDLLRENRTLD